MADRYNPNIPQIIGNEYVGIRDEDLIFDPFANTYERGFEFNYQSSDLQIQDIRCYLNTFPIKYFRYGSLTMNLYPVGTEDGSGPVRSVIIPCNNGIVTGDNGGGIHAAYSFGGGATNAATALWNPSGVQYLEMRVGELYRSAASLFFAVDQYHQLLNGKRILGVDFLTSVDMGNTISTNGTNDQGSIFLAVDNTAGIVLNNGVVSTGAVVYPSLVTPTTPLTFFGPVRTKLGDVNRFFGTTTGNAFGNFNCQQWTYKELQRFEMNSPSRLAVRFCIPPIGIQSGSINVLFTYAALEVFYCEERRTAFGTKILQESDTTVAAVANLGVTPIQVRTQAGAVPSLSSGQYAVTMSQSNLGDATSSTVNPMIGAKFNALRTLPQPYADPVVAGVQVNLPFPLNAEVIGSQITSERSVIIPQLAIQVSGSYTPPGALIPRVYVGPLAESNVFGRQAIAQVYSASTPAFALQTETVDPVSLTPLSGAGRSYSWLRVWVRRWGQTTGSLRVQVVDSVTYTSSISVAELDALPEIIDGWRAVDFDFVSTPILLTGGARTATFTSQPTLNAGDRWEVLGCNALAVSGIPGNQLNLAAGTNSLDTATYRGTLSYETWLPQNGPYVSGATIDTATDLSFMFSQTQPTVTGFTIEEQSQPVSGIGEYCGEVPCCIPTHILYNELSWGGPVNTGVVHDTFQRTVSDSWGTADSGQAWNAITTGPATQADVDGTQGTIVPSSNAVRVMAIPNIGIDFDVKATLGLASAYLTTQHFGLVGRYTDINNRYSALVVTSTGGSASFRLQKTVAGSNTTLLNISLPFNIADQSYGFVNMRFMGYGSFLKAKIWALDDDEPDQWNLEYEDTSLTTGSGVGVTVFDISGGPGATYAVTSFDVSAPADFFGYYELQRQDELDSDWNTIMKCTDIATTSFNDYEARVGLESEYRIRTVDLYEFPGPWSATVANTITDPGIVGGDCVMAGHVLLFTSNERQDGSSNLAYASVWTEGQVQENFNFPEAGFVQLQSMYDRNYFTAFRPTERGGEAFSRTLLVQAAAIAPPTLADFTSLRSMAWDSTNYVCVRDEDGNRWFATVLVPDGRVLNNRKIYLATVGITEVTDTPTPVDPAA